MKTDYFPLGIAKGKAFCNRLKERKLLKANIDHNRHTLLIAHRRQGKTSLVEKVVSEIIKPRSKIIYTRLDFSLVSTDDAIQPYV